MRSGKAGCVDKKPGMRKEFWRFSAASMRWNTCGRGWENVGMLDTGGRGGDVATKRIKRKDRPRQHSTYSHLHAFMRTYAPGWRPLGRSPRARRGGRPPRPPPAVKICVDVLGCR